jgi:probable HAF family extracellular repeat protein
MCRNPDLQSLARGCRLAVFLAAAGAAVPAAAQSEYEFFLVEAFNLSYSLREAYVTEINEHNQACGTATSGSSYSGFIWTEATDKQAIPVSAPKGLNNHGVVVDNDFVYDTVPGTSTTVPGVGGFGVVRLRDVNDSGMVVGHGWTGSPCSQVICYAPLLWDQVSGSRLLAGVANARRLDRINDSGVVLGHIARTNFDRTEAFVYDLNSGMWTNLSDGLPPQWLAGFAITEAVDISNTGAVVGRALYAQDPYRAFLWTPGSGHVMLPGLHGGDVDRVHPLGVNTSNIVVGRAMDGTNTWRAFIWQAELGMRDLNQLTVAAPGFILDSASKINDNGWIVGYGHFGPGWGTARGFVLKPINQTQPCYANCDSSTTAPILNVDDFTCFINEFAAAQQLAPAQQVEHYANCDNSTVAPVLNVDDFMCFIKAFAQGCP